ncbi:hypothetical protein IAT38_000037 [Cryptococcus sp. DSM 104549]
MLVWRPHHLHRADALSRTFYSAAAVDSWAASLMARPSQLTVDVVDVERASQLQRMLPTRQDCASVNDLPIGTHLPRAHHLVFFRPKTMMRELGPDGSSTELNAPPPFSRRMWAGGSMTWSGVSLAVGEPVTQALSVPRVELKKDMVFVYQRRVLYPGVKDIDDGEGWAVQETRTHVFRPLQEAPAALTKKKDPTTPTSPTTSTSPPAPYSFTYLPTSPLLFLYSALTHNPHKVHYDKDWTVKREGHRAPLVHGPLTATLLVELAGQVKGRKLKVFEYRATSPMVVDEEIALTGRWEKDGALKLEATQGGAVGMRATARYGSISG